MAHKHQDIIIIGGGIVGLTTAILLAKKNLHVVLIDKKDLNLKPPFLANQAYESKSEHAQRILLREHVRDQQDSCGSFDLGMWADGRSYAISHTSSLVFEKAGIWEFVKEELSPILDIRVSDNHCPIFLHYDHKLVSDQPMGYMLEAAKLDQAAYDKAKKQKNLTIISPANISKIHHDNNKVEIFLDNGQNIQANLLIAADGKNSQIRKLAEIKSLTHDYKQTAIVCNIWHENHHHNLAQENFFPTGPFASLPLKGGHYSSLVWVENSDIAPLYITMDDTECAEHIATRIPDYLGKIKLTSKRQAFPLKLNQAQKYYANRIALIGDAAHGIHPLAGQGLNLGIDDSAALTDLLLQKHRLGLDIGTQSLLREYNKSRRLDSWLMIAVTHGLNKLFNYQAAPIKIIRQSDMAIINQIPLIKKMLINQAR